MAKVLLVEDDNNLREIYEARLQAEGYTIVSAKDGEEALVVAKAEKPDLVVADVMMPKISGFEMLDILHNTPELKGVKVIMLTALGQSEDQQRASQLGADRYLVKSQVTLEDIVKTTHELLGEGGTGDDVADEAATDATPPAEPAASAAPAATSTDDTEDTTQADTKPADTDTDDTTAPATPPAKPDVDAEQAASDTVAESTAQEESEVEAKIENFVAGATSEPTAPEPPQSSDASPDTSSKTAPAETPDAANPVADGAAPAPTPAADTPEPPSDPSDTSAPPATGAAAISDNDDKLMSEAVDKLVASTKTSDNETATPAAATDATPPPEPAAPATTSTAPPVVITPDVTPVAPSAPLTNNSGGQAPETPEPAKQTDKAEPGTGTITHTKVIKPLENPTPKKSLDELLAEEEAAEIKTDPSADGGTTGAGSTPGNTNPSGGIAL